MRDMSWLLADMHFNRISRQYEMAADTEPYRKLLVRLSYDKPTNVALGTPRRAGREKSSRFKLNSFQATGETMRPPAYLRPDRLYLQWRGARYGPSPFFSRLQGRTTEVELPKLRRTRCD